MPRPLTPPDRSHCGSCQYKHTDDDQEKDERHQEKEGSPHFRKHDDYLLIHRPSRLTSFSVPGILPCWYLQILFRIDQLLLLRLWPIENNGQTERFRSRHRITGYLHETQIPCVAPRCLTNPYRRKLIFYTYRYMYIVMDNLEQSA